MHKWTIRHNWQWYGWWRCDDFICIFDICSSLLGLLTTVGDTWHTCLADGTLSARLAPRVTHCHGPSAKTSFLRPQPSDSSILGDSLPSPHTHELWQYPDIIYLTKTNNRSTLQSKPRERGTREFNNWFNAPLHNKAKDFAKRWGQKQLVYTIICQARRAQREISDKKSQIIISSEERRVVRGNSAFLLVCWF